jgi:hypothetical protein
MIMEASVDPQPWGPDWMPITHKEPQEGSFLHAETQTEKACDFGGAPGLHSGP